MESIVKHLNSLEKLDVEHTNIDFSTLLQLKSIPTLKILRWFGHPEEIKNLKIQLPHISINEEYLYIAVPTKKVKDPIDLDWFWEIKAKQQTLFPKVHYIDFFECVFVYFLENLGKSHGPELRLDLLMIKA